MENLHWIDLETQAFIESLAEVVPHHRLLLLFNYRQEYRHPWLSADHVTDLKITPLTPPLAAELLQTLVGPDATLRPLKRHPDRAKAIRSSSRRWCAAWSRPGGTRWDTGRLPPGAAGRAVQVPETVKALLAARIDRLPFEEERLLQSAAVIGRHVDVGLLREIADVPRE